MQFLGPSSNGRQAPGRGCNSCPEGTNQRSGKNSSGRTQYDGERCISTCRIQRIASSVGSALPASSVTLTPGLPARVVPAGGKSRSTSFMTARVYGRSFTRRGFCASCDATVVVSVPRTLSCSSRSFLRTCCSSELWIQRRIHRIVMLTSGFCARRWKQ
jgi:hypothetical protein